MAEKQAILGRAAAEGAWILLEHDPLVAFARPAVDGDDFKWSETIAASAAATGGR